jgi:hypothetical protein
MQGGHDRLEFATITSGVSLIVSVTCFLINSGSLPANRVSIWTLRPFIQPKSRIPSRNSLMRPYASRSFSSRPSSTVTRRMRSGACACTAPGQVAAEPAIILMKSHRLMPPPRAMKVMLSAKTSRPKGLAYVCFGSKADFARYHPRA